MPAWVGCKAIASLLRCTHARPCPCHASAAAIPLASSEHSFASQSAAVVLSWMTCTATWRQGLLVSLVSMALWLLPTPDKTSTLCGHCTVRPRSGIIRLFRHYQDPFGHYHGPFKHYQSPCADGNMTAQKRPAAASACNKL